MLKRTPFNLSKVMISHFRKRVMIKLRAEQNVILPEFLTIYSHTVCNPHIINLSQFTASVENTRTCLENMEVPPLEVQSNILRSLHKMAMITDIAGFEGQFIKLMMQDDRPHIKELFEAIVNYNISIDDLNKVMASIPDLDPKPSSNI